MSQWVVFPPKQYLVRGRGEDVRDEEARRREREREI
jgi:hypothetical protein